jgi:phosphonopyruvate decarboxylase
MAEQARDFNLVGKEIGRKSLELYEALDRGGVDACVTVPCGVQKDAIRLYATNWLHVFATRESEAAGIAAGMWLGGRTPIISMQNSGLLNTFNDLLSLQMAYGIPVLMAVTHRGAPESVRSGQEDAAQHMLTGAATKPMLDAAGIRYEDYADASSATRLVELMRETGKPVALLIKRGQMRSGDAGTAWSYNEPTREAAPSYSEITRMLTGERMKRDDALETINGIARGRAGLISSTGIMSRTLFGWNGYSPDNFYVTGSMGLVAPIGLGAALARPERKIVCIDGDASALMMLGGQATIGNRAPRNLTHIVVNNGSYASCSEEPSAGRNVNYAGLAREFGYKRVWDVDSPDELGKALETSLESDGPNFIHARITLGGPRDPPRPNEEGLRKIASGFREYLASSPQ